jgi:hypothetical protein
MQLEDVRTLALRHPEVTEQPHHHLTSFRVRGTIFATAPEDGSWVNVFVEESETRACVAEDPTVFAELWWGKRLSGLRVTLDRADPARVAELLEDAWRRKAPASLVKRRDA